MKKIIHLISLAILLLTVVAARANNVRDGLVAYWPLDDATGGVAADVAFTNTMRIVGSQTVSSGQRSNAFTFTGPSTYLTNLHDADNAISGLPIYRAGAYTITMWVKGTNQTAKYLYSEGNLTTTTPIFILQTGQAAGNNNKFDVVIRNDGNTTLVNHVVSTSVVFDNNWHHIAWVDDFGNVKLYVDGNLDSANFSYTPAGTMTVQASAIGTLVRTTVSTGAIFNGQIDDVAVWERPLSQADVNFVRTNGIPMPVVAMAPGLYPEPPSAIKHTGDWHRFVTTAYGSRPYLNTYQWNKNGSPIPGTTDRTLFLSTAEVLALNPGDFFSVTATNDIGATTSSNATLTLVSDPAPAVTNGLAQYWPLDVILEAGTNLVSPELHFGHTMVLRGFPDTNSFVSGQYNNALNFDAFSKYGFRTNGTPVYNNPAYSVSLWVRGDFNLQSDRRVFSEGSSASANSLFTLGTDSGGANPSMRVFIRNSSNVAQVNGRNSTRPVFDNSWHLVVWTDDNGQAKLYIDGTLDETDYTYTRSTLTLNQTSIGATAQAAVAGFYGGDIDEVATWNRVLTWTEIQQVMTNGVPVPQGIVAPTITVQPPDRTNGIYAGDDVTFPVQVGGTLPMNIQWWKGVSPISAALNPSAVTDTLVLTNVQVADSNTTYSVIVTNASGSVTSSVVRLYVIPFTPATNGEVLKLDVGLTGTANLQPGFSELSFAQTPSVSSGSGLFSNALQVTFSSIGTDNLLGRYRLSPPDARMVTNVPPDMTQAQIYNDFVFANNTTDGTGLRVLIERLAPNTHHGLTVWSFDPISTPARISDWTETASGTPVTIVSGYTFDGLNVPTNDFQYVFGGLLTSSASGKLQLEGVKNGGGGVAAFVNGIRLVANPTGTRITRTELLNGNIRLTVEGDYPGQPISIHQSANLVNWSDTLSSPVETFGPLLTFEIPVSGNQTFYRAVSYPTW